MKKNILTITAAIAFACSAFAHEHAPALLKGETLELFEQEHAFAGKVLNSAVFAGFDHQPFGTTLVVRKNNKTLQTRIETPAPREGLDSKLLGILTEQISAEESVVTTVSLQGIQRNEDQSALFNYLVDEKLVTVLVKGERFENNHFMNSTFTATLADGEVVSWTFSGESCFAYSANIAASILLAHTHLKK